ncbi:hypothetical protein F442_17059 [Phytophthora nicotianae P10297]|uniref:Elicitin n=1 Tax=Phytophthora nicotianae P10297 TaxID=1317064 RepID=W2YIK7_PHYNI|nr:hypothetical protein F442_17059 [Phytophthora nicotianae P10297]
MKITFATLLLLNAAVFFNGVTAAPCDTTAIAKLLINGNVQTCRADSGYNPASMTAATDAQVTAVCNSNACTEAMKALKQVAPEECTIGPVRLYADIIDPLERRCGRKFGAAGSAGSAGNASAAGSGPAVGDSPTTTKPPTNTPASPRTTPPSTTPANGGTDKSTLSAVGAAAVLATVAAAIL